MASAVPCSPGWSYATYTPLVEKTDPTLTVPVHDDDGDDGDDDPPLAAVVFDELALLLVLLPQPASSAITTATPSRPDRRHRFLDGFGYPECPCGFCNAFLPIR